MTVAYDNFFTEDLAGLLEDGAGAALERFSAQLVANNSTVADHNDAIWPALSSHSLTVEEGGTATYTVALDSQPAEGITIALTVNPEGHLTVDDTELTFTTENWNTPQTVTLTAGENDSCHNSWQEVVHTSTTDGLVSGHVKVLVEQQ